MGVGVVVFFDRDGVWVELAAGCTSASAWALRFRRPSSIVPGKKDGPKPEKKAEAEPRSVREYVGRTCRAYVSGGVGISFLGDQCLPLCFRMFWPR